MLKAVGIVVKTDTLPGNVQNLVAVVVMVAVAVENVVKMDTLPENVPMLGAVVIPLFSPIFRL